jgi:hypothetical protein
MAKFITGHDLNAEMGKLFEGATSQLILISPYVKLHHRFESVLLPKRTNDKLKIIVVFGKNEENPARSIRIEDISFFKQFPNIEIRYEKRLHAKYYANESSAIITSMNLYDYSQDNNIESGILMTQPVMRGFLENLDDQAYGYFQRVIDQSDLLYHNKPHREETLLGLSSKYVKSTVEIDKLDSLFQKGKALITKLEDSGYCIITGSKIPFNIEKPLSEKAYKAWVKKSDPLEKGKYCHFSGEAGNTSYNKPILNKNWKSAKEKYGL